VHAVSEAHETASLPILHLGDEPRDVLGVLDLLDHVQHGLVGAAVQRSVQRRDARRDRRERVHLGRAHRAHRARGAILLVVRVEDEQHFERFREDRIRLVLRLRHAGHHREKVLDEAEIVVGVDERQTLRMAEDERRERGHFGQQPDDRDVALIGILDVLGFGVERRQRRDRRGEHRHRMRVIAEAAHEFLDVFVHVRVERDVVHPLVVVLLARQLAVTQQPRDLEESGLVRELLDGIAAIPQDALVAVDERDRALARRCVHEGGVVRHQAELVGLHLDLSQIHRADRRVAFGAWLEHGDRVRLAGTTVLDLDRARCGIFGSGRFAGFRRLRGAHATFSLGVKRAASGSRASQSTGPLPAATLPSIKLALVVVSALIAGVMNSIAGGGTLVTFPALIALGVPPINANATSTVALWPGAVGSMWGYRGELRGSAPWALGFALPSLLGGALGAYLLLRTPPERFADLVPWLVLGATALFIVQRPVMRRLAQSSQHAVQSDEELMRRRPPALILGFQFLVAIYGGYFGAGVGILMLAALGFMGLANIHRMNGLKNWGGLCMNAIAALLFAFSRLVDWPVALGMAAGAMVGGYTGSRVAQRVGQRAVRWAIIVIGLGSGLVMLAAQLRR